MKDEGRMMNGEGRGDELVNEARGHTRPTSGRIKANQGESNQIKVQKKFWRGRVEGMKGKTPRFEMTSRHHEIRTCCGSQTRGPWAGPEPTKTFRDGNGV